MAVILGRKPGGSGGGGGAPSGPAGGDLGGTYPNPAVATVDDAVLGSGTPDSTTFLRGDRAWAVPAGAFTEVYSPDVAPDSPNVMDDEFAGSVLDAKWSWRNQGGASWAQDDGWGQLTAPQNSGQSLRSIVQSVSGTFDIRAKVSFMPHAKVDFYLAGLSVWNNSSGKGYFLAFFQNASSFDVGMWPANSNTSLGTVIGQTSSANIVWLARVQYMRFVNDGTNITGYMSIDGRNWRSLGWTAALATHISSIDRIGITMDNENASNGNEWIVAEWFRRIS